jgi:hypothetical protein
MRYTNEEIEILANEYAERVGITKEKASKLFTQGYLIEKTGSESESYLVENPDYLDDNGMFQKTRRKNTHLTPKKKKRKKK